MTLPRPKLSPSRPKIPSPHVWETPFGLPPFARSRRSISARPSRRRWPSTGPRSTRSSPIPRTPDFANTIEALERAGRALSRVGGVFYNLTGADTNEALQAIEREMSPLTSRHWSAIMMDPGCSRASMR